MLRRWRHTGLAHWPTRFIDISTVHPLSSPQKWVTRTGVARTGFVLSQTLTLSLSVLLSLPSLSLFLCYSLVLSASFYLTRYSALSLFVWKHGVSEECLLKYLQRCSRINARKNYTFAEHRYFFFIIRIQSHFCSMFLKINNFAFFLFVILFSIIWLLGWRNKILQILP